MCTRQKKKLRPIIGPSYPHCNKNWVTNSKVKPLNLDIHLTQGSVHANGTFCNVVKFCLYWDGPGPLSPWWAVMPECNISLNKPYINRPLSNFTHQVKVKSHWLTAPSTGHYCNEGRISRSIGTNSVQCILIQMYSKWIDYISIGKTLI